MSLNREDVCVFIKNDKQLNEAKELLKKYNQETDKEMFSFAVNPLYWYLKYSGYDDNWYLSTNIETEITLSELKIILQQPEK